MNLGKTIQIYLPDGNPRSIKIAEFTNRTIKAVLVPKSKLDFASTRSELNNVGIYFLVGESNDELKPILYVGEAEDCLNRLKQHNKGKDFWTTAIVIVSSNKQFTKTHIKYLESYCYDVAVNVQRYKLDNSSVPTAPHIPEPLQADLLDIFETIKILISTLGFPIFDQIIKPDKKSILYCKGKNALAEGELTEDGFVVFAGSIANKEIAPSAALWVTQIQKKLIEDNILVEENNAYKFVSNYIFKSPSTAATIVLARSSNGRIEWKNKEGKTIDELAI